METVSAYYSEEKCLMFNHIGTVSIFVSDQQRAKEFYTNVLGFELRQDAPLFPGAEARWIAVAPKGAKNRTHSLFAG